jgi:hypothetical protein
VFTNRIVSNTNGGIIMTIKINGSISEKILNKYQSVSKGTPGTAEIVPISIPNLLSNRQPKGANISKYIDRNNGFDWALFGMPTVARYPNGLMEIIDGGHRVAMLQCILPDITQYTACVVDLANEARGKELFHQFNGTSSSTVSNECRFVNEVLGNEDVPLNKRIVKVLNATGVTVYEHEDCYVSEGIKSPQWKINFKAIEYMVKKDIPTTIQALNIYTTAFPTRGTTPNSVVNQFAKALQQLLLTYSSYFTLEANVDNLNAFLNHKALDETPATMLSKEYTHARMEKFYLGTAYGLMQNFRRWVERNSKKGGITVPEMAPIKDLYMSHMNKGMA